MFLDISAQTGQEDKGPTSLAQLIDPLTAGKFSQVANSDPSCCSLSPVIEQRQKLKLPVTALNFSLPTLSPTPDQTRRAAPSNS